MKPYLLIDYDEKRYRFLITLKHGLPNVPEIPYITDLYTDVAPIFGKYVYMLNIDDLILHAVKRSLAIRYILNGYKLLNIQVTPAAQSISYDRTPYYSSVYILTFRGLYGLEEVKLIREHLRMML